ncbi:hypothetical protein PT974_09433 [Cladobotryum mycophilum]|uniref:Uncharacterized protein n=1 Tax=Cladobotryum mycophilum TaxID=491253 RepID=A0ABR0SHB1_9HYPO
MPTPNAREEASSSDAPGNNQRERVQPWKAFIAQTKESALGADVVTVKNGNGAGSSGVSEGPAAGESDTLPHVAA